LGPDILGAPELRLYGDLRYRPCSLDRLAHGEISLVRAPYAVDRTIRAVRDAPLPAAVAEDLAQWLLSGNAPPSRHLS